VSFAAGVHSVSKKGFVSTYCESVGIDMNFATKSFLERHTIYTINKAAHEKTLSVKRKRSRGKKLKQIQGITYETAYRLTSRDEKINEIKNLNFYTTFLRLC
jgi:hypothetical protein